MGTDIFIKKYPQLIENGIISLKLLCEHLTIVKELVKMGVYDKSLYYELLEDVRCLDVQEHRDRILNELLND